MITAADLIEAKRVFDNQPLPGKRLWLVFDSSIWKYGRIAGIELARFTDEEIDKAAATNDGYLGVSKGIDCYVTINKSC